MEHRKLIKFGAKTYCISLPKPWIREHKLKKGDTINIERLDDGSLKVLGTADASQPEIKEISFNVTSLSADEVRRRILVAYINDYTIIRLCGTMGGRAAELKDIFKQFVALEVLDITSDSITAKAFIDVSETEPLVVLRRVDTIVRAMFSGMRDCLKDSADFNFVLEREEEVDRLSSFALKLITRGLNEPANARQWKMTPAQVAFIMVFCEKLEKIGDRLRHLAEIIPSMKFRKETRGMILQHLVTVEENYRRALSAFYKGDISLANEVLGRHNEIVRQLEWPSLNCNKDRCARVGFGLPLVLDHLVRISLLTKDISRVVLDIHPDKYSSMASGFSKREKVSQKARP